MEQKDFSENKGTKSEVEHTNKGILKVGNAEKVLSESSDNSMNLPSNIVKDRGKIECDERSEASGDISRAQNKKDFRETAQYRDAESYINQHHHSIGEGLYMTDEIRDLPPRFRTKVMQALENALVMNNIKLDRNPLEYFTSFSEDSKELDKNEDKLVYIPPSISECRKSIGSKSGFAPPVKTNFIEKKSSNSHHHSNFDSSSHSLEIGAQSFSDANINFQVPSQNLNKNSRKCSPSKKSSSYTNNNDFKNYNRISIDELFSAAKSDSKATLVSNNTVNNSCSASPIYEGVASSSELHRKRGNGTVPHNDSTINLNTKTYKSRTFTDSKSNSKYSDKKNTSFNELKRPFAPQGNCYPIHPTSSCGNKLHAGSLKSTKYSVNDSFTSNDTCSAESGVKSKSKKIQPNAFSDVTTASKYNKTNSESFNSFQNVSQSSNNSGEDHFSNSKGIPSKNFDSNKGKSCNNSSYSTAKNVKKHSKKENIPYNSGKSFDVHPEKEESNMVQDLSLKNTSVQHKHRKHSDPHSSISSSYSSKSNDNGPRHNHLMTLQGSSVNSANSNLFESLSQKKPTYQQFDSQRHRKHSDSHSSISSSYSSKSNDNGPRHNHLMTLQGSSVNSADNNSFESFSHKKHMYQQFDRQSDYNKKSKNYPNRKDNHSDSSSVFSDNSVKTYNSSGISSVWDNFDQPEKNISNKTSRHVNSKPFVKSPGKQFAERSGKFCMNSKLSEKLRDKEISQKKFSSGSSAENLHYSNKTDHIPTKSSNNNEYNKLRPLQYEKRNKHNMNVCIEPGFFVKVEVSEKVKDLECWMRYFQSIFSFPFEFERCCRFSDIIILDFERKEHANTGLNILHREKKVLRNLKKPHFLQISKLLHHLTKPCNCREKVINDCVDSIETHFKSSLCVANSKIAEICNSKSTNTKNARYKGNSSESKIVKSLEDSKLNFRHLKEKIVSDIESAEDLRTIQHHKHSFVRECNTFKRCLPIYCKKEEIVNLARNRSVSVIVADTGSGKSTQLVEYILHSSISENGLIICTQPRKLAAVTIAHFVCGQMGSAIGKLVGYDVGIEKKCSDMTKIIYMTDYCLLKYFLTNRDLRGVSCIIIDEAHERSLYTDLILGLLKKCLDINKGLSVIITSATINPDIFVNYFNMTQECVLEVPGRTYPVDVVWYPSDVVIGWDYLDACVRQAYEIHVRKGEGDILVFLTSPSESEEAIHLFKRLLSNQAKKAQLLNLHGKSDFQEQMLIFQETSKSSRKIIFATNVAETAVTIPGIRYVVDSGMSKELMFDPQKNKSYLSVTFTTKSAAEQRKGRAGRTQSGVCYRMYSKRNYAENMADNAVPEILKSNLQKALLKIFEFGIDPEKFDFIEAPPAKTISNSVESLEYIGAIENKKLTNFGKKLVKLPLEPQLSKFVLQGIEAKIGIEAIIIAALVSESGKLFIRNEDNRARADEKKKKFCHEGGDLCTYLEIYKRFKEINIPERYTWCVDNFISFKALKAAEKTIKEILITLRNELKVPISTRYNNNDDYKKQYEKIIFDSFSENLCVLSGHSKLGYLSPYLPESFFIHPSSTLSYLGKDSPEFLVYSTLMETSRNFLFDITPISEATLKLAYQTGKFKLPIHTLRCLQIPPKIMGPFGESVIIRHILGKRGMKIRDLETALMHLTSAKNLYIDVDVAKGLITMYISRKHHEKANNHVQQIINKALAEMLKEEDVVKLTGTSMYFALGAGGIISDVIMPGEFRELVFNSVQAKDSNELENILQMYGPLQMYTPLQSLSHVASKQEMQISATFEKVCDAKKAFLDLKERKKVSPKPYLPDLSDKTLPLHMLLISWCCSPSNGSGLVEFISQESLIEASGILTCDSFFVGNNLIMFSVAQENCKLKMNNLPEYVEESTIKEKIKEKLPHIKVKSIKIYRKYGVIKEGAVEEARKKLSKLLSLYVFSSKFTIDLKYPKKEASWNATVYFDNAADAENTFMKLKDNACIDSYPLSVRQIFKSNLFCKRDVYDKVSVYINWILKEKRAKGICEEFSITLLKETFNSNVRVEFSCVNLKELYKTRQSLRQFLEGEYLEFFGNSKYHFLFTGGFVEQIKKIQRSTNTIINLHMIKKVISIHGIPSDCRKAKEKIYQLACNPDYSFTRTFKLRDSCIPSGFLKHLYTKYGYDLNGLVADFKLTVASIDNYGCTLTLKGLKEQIRKAEQALEKICEELFESRGERQKTSIDEEACPICFDPLSYDFQRLEHCGHAFCRQCLLLQIESKIIPLVCVKQDCGKLIFLEDMKRILSFGEDHLKKTFCAVALQYHVSCNVGKLNYCRTPDCQMMYRVTEEGSEYNCLSCKNSTCTRCHSPYHSGMTCEMFQECQKDEDYSLKMWVKEDETTRKHCPSCKTVIEKFDGCNHMDCLNCKAHLCWLCLQIFKTDDEVYSHLPYCPKNQ